MTCSPTNIIDGVYQIIDESLGITDIGQSPHFKRKTSCLRLKSTPFSFDPLQVISQIYKQLERNLKHPSNPFNSKDPSVKNWRFEKMLDMDDNNPNPETRLEKKIANLPTKDWVNQVPTSSGLINSSSDKKRNIDLVHRLEPENYEFIELKVESDYPLYAAFEILIYSLIYLLSRENYPSHCIESKEILKAKKVSLQTLAPVIYYYECSLNWLEEDLNIGLKKFLYEKFDDNVAMDFSFTSFPNTFNCSSYSDEELSEALNNRVAVNWATNQIL